MSFRTVVIKNRCKLEYSLNYMVVRGETEKRIWIEEIELLIIQSTSVSLTTALLSELVNHKIKVIFCDGKQNPQSELVPCYGSYNTYKRIEQQISFEDDIKELLWSRIIAEKITNESRLLKFIGKNKESLKLENYLLEIELGDRTNREGHAAKVYFNSLFGNDFARGDDHNPINKLLNYGYAIIISFLNREIKSMGYLTELGIHHVGETNPFNLTYDIFEPLRSFVDAFVVKGLVNEDNYKDVFQRMLTSKVKIDSNLYYLDNAVHVYVGSLFNSLIKKDISLMKFIEYEL